MSSSDIESALLLGSKGSSTPKAELARPLLFSVCATFGNYIFGFGTAFTGGLGTVLEDPSSKGLGLSSSQNAFFSAVVNAGAMIGAVFGGWLTQKIGRKNSIGASCIPFMAGFLLMSLAHSYAVALVGRILVGVGVGLVSVAAPVYVTEIAPNSMRGALGSLCQLQVTIGVLVVLTLGRVVAWRILSWIGFAHAAFLFVLTFLMPESPRYLYSKGDVDGAHKALVRLRSNNANIDFEMNEISFAVSQSGSEAVSIGALFQGANAKALIVASLFMIYQQFSGVNAVTFFLSTIFEDAGFSNTTLAVIIFGLVQVFVTAISCLVVDKAGRRVLLIVAGLGMSASSAILGYHFMLVEDNRSSPGLVPLLSVLTYIASFSIGLGPIPWLMASEIFASNVRGMAASVATIINWGSSFTVVMTFSMMNDSFRESGSFFFYAAVCLAGALYTRFGGVPETKGKVLEDIIAYFEGRGEVSMDDPRGNAQVLFAFFVALLFVGVMFMWASA